MITRLVSRRTAFLTLGLAAALAVALGLWAFQAERASAHPLDVNVTLTSSPGTGTTVAQGSIITYTAIVTSDGPTTSVGASFPLTIDLSGVTLVTGSIQGTGISCTGPDPLLCEVADFTGAGSKTVEFKASLGAGGPALVGAALDPAAALSFGEVDEGLAGETPEDGGNDTLICDTVGELTVPNAGPAGPTPPEEPDNFACTSHSVGTANLTITKSAVPAEGATVGTGGTITYTITVANDALASGIASGVAVRDTFETTPKVSLTNVQVTPPDVCTDTALPEIECTIASLAPGTSRTIIITGTVIASAGATILNGVRVDRANAIPESVGTGPEDAGDILACDTVDEGPDPGGITSEPDNFDCTQHTVTAGTVDLTITKSASPAESSGVDTGNTITYTLTARNESTATATASNVTIRDWLGTGLTFVSLTGGTGVTCPADTVSPFDCTAASIAPGESRTATLVATVSASSGTVMNGARVDPDNAIPETAGTGPEDADDPDLTCGTTLGEGTDAAPATERDNYDCTEHTVGAAAGLNLTVTKTATPAETVTVATGATIVYTITVSASGAAATSVAIRDTIGTGLSLTSVTPGSGVTCADTTAPEINCSAATIAAGSSVTVTVNTTVTATSGTVLNGARVDPLNAITESNDDADDPSLVCSDVGEGTDTGDATEPDNFDCTSHTVGGAATRTLNLSPAGWHNFVWTGASATPPATALTCISGKFSIAYEWVDSAQRFDRFVPGNTELTNMQPLTQYDPLLVLITAEGVTCQMAVAS